MRMSEVPQRPSGSQGLEEGVVEKAEIQRRAVVGSFWTALHTLLSVPIAFGVNAVVARALGPSDYGNVALLTLVLGLVSQCTHFGMSDATLQWGAVAAARGDRGEVRKLLAKSLGFHVYIQLPLLIITALIMSFDNWWVFGVLVISMIFTTALGSATLLVSIENRTASGAKLAMVGNLAVQGSLLLASTSRSATWVWAARTLTTALVVPFNFLLVDTWGRRAACSIAWPRRLPAGFWKFGAMTMIAGLGATLVFSRSEILALDWFHERASAGLFALAFGVAVQITAPVDAVVGPLGPAASALVGVHPERARAGRQRAVRMTALLSGVILATIAPAFALTLKLIYGQGFSGAEVPFLVLATVSCLQSVCNPFQVFQRARRRAARLLVLTVVALVVDLALAVSLVPRFGLGGALVANVGGQLAFFGPLLVAEARDARESIATTLSGIRAYFVALFCAVAAYLGPGLVGADGWLAAALASLIGLGFFALALRLTRCGMLVSDWEALSTALPQVVARAMKPVSLLLGVRN
jgi:O-antigen/teichoic acid export membrane protein